MSTSASCVRRALAAALVLLASSSRVAPTAAAERIRLVTTETSTAAVTSDPGGGAALVIDTTALARLAGLDEVVIEGWPLPGAESADLALESFDVVAPDAILLAGSKDHLERFMPPPMRFFRGVVRGHDGSLAYLWLDGEQIGGFVSFAGVDAGDSRLYRFGPRDATGKDPSGEIAIVLAGTTASAADGSGADEPVTYCQPPPVRLGSLPARLERLGILSTTPMSAGVAIDTTVEYYNHFGNVAAATRYALSLVGAVSTIYQSNVACRIRLNYFRLFTAEPDPYPTTGNSLTLLDAFTHEWRTNPALSDIPRAAAHLFTRRGNLGGIAYVDALCDADYSYGLSDLDLTYTYPRSSYTWDADVLSHELGHNFASPHTHCYVPEIDRCYNRESGCYGGPVEPRVGTIMSYCHLVASKNLVFSTRERDVIRPALEAAACIVPARRNVALAAEGAVAQASSTYPPAASSPAAAAIDGDRLGLVWGSGGGWADATADAYPDWLQVTFAGSRVIDEVDVYTLQDNYSLPVEPDAGMSFASYGITAFDVQVWNGASWSTVPGGTIDGNNKVRRKVTFPATATTRIRVNVRGALASYSRIVEIEAYETQGPVPPSVAVQSPNGGEILNAGTVRAISWSAAGLDPAGQLELAYLLNGSWVAITTLATTATSHSWTVPATPTAAGLVRVEYRLGGSLLASDQSDGAFQIQVPRRNVALAANGGVASASSSFNASTPPASLVNGDRKGLGWGAGGGWADATPGVFPDWAQVQFAGQRTIDEVSVYTLQDNYGAPIEPTATTSFSLYGVTAFDVQVWSGGTWVTVSGGAINGNTRVWRKVTFPAVTTDRVRVNVRTGLASYSRLVEIEAFESSGPAQPAVTILNPNGGESFEVGSVRSLSWSASGLNPAGQIELAYLLSGVWIPIATKSTTATSHSWTVPATPTDSARLRAEYRLSGSVLTSDQSDATFRITSTTTRRNHALATNGGVASASSVFSTATPVSSLINGDHRGAGWGAGGGWADGTANAFPDWVQVNFAGSKSITEVSVFTLQDAYTAPVEPTLSMTFALYGVTSFDVQTWSGGTWTTIAGGAITGNNKVWRKVTFPAVTTDRVRVLVRGGLASYSRLVEIEAY